MLVNFSTWAVGIINGYQYKENKLPSSYTYGIISIATGINIIKALGRSQTLPSMGPGILLSGLFIGIPLITGSVFCTGNMIGKSIRHMSDMESKK
jgi:hypothetical protein